jgi:hypothetical protein
LRRTIVLLVFPALLAAAGAAEAQDLRMSTVVDNMVGAAGDTREARLLFTHDADELCVTIAIPTGPSALRAKLFRFARRGEGDSRSKVLKFPLPSKPQRPAGHDERLQVWQGCLPLEEDGGAAAESTVIDVHYQDPRRLKESSEFAVAYPGVGTVQGLDVLKDSAGNLMFQSFQPAADPAL